jgi:hypothetical protein
LQDLANHGLDLEAYGGDTPVVMVSAPTGRGLRELEDAVLYQVAIDPACGSLRSEHVYTDCLESYLVCQYFRRNFLMSEHPTV